MSISIDGSSSQVNLKELFSKQLDGKSFNGTESGSSVVLNGDSVTISTRDPASGKTVARTVSADESGFKAFQERGVQSLYAGAAMVDEIVDLLGALADECGMTPLAGSSEAKVPSMSLGEVGAALKEEATVSGEEMTNRTVLAEETDAKHAFFDIYACMTLLQQVGQQERNAARELKIAELSNEVSSIMTQANQQREAGVLGAIVSACTVAAQVGLMAVSVCKSASSIKSSYNTGAAQDASFAESKAGTLQAQGKGQQATQANLEKIQGKTSPEAKAQVERVKTESGVYKAQDDLTAAKANETKVTQEMTAVKEQNTAKSQALDVRIGELQRGPNGAPNPKAEAEIKSLQSEKAACQKNITDADTKIAVAKKNTTTCQKEYVSSMENAQKKLDGTYREASGETTRAESAHVQEDTKQTAAEVTSCRQNQKTAGSACKLMDAEVANEKAKLGIKPASGEIEKAQITANNADREMMGNPVFQKTQNFAWNMLFQTMPHMAGQLGQSCSTMAHDIASSEATAEQANQKTAELYRDEANSLLQQAQDLITSARECFKAVIQAESQSIEQIIRA